MSSPWHVWVLNYVLQLKKWILGWLINPNNIDWTFCHFIKEITTSCRKWSDFCQGRRLLCYILSRQEALSEVATYSSEFHIESNNGTYWSVWLVHEGKCNIIQCYDLTKKLCELLTWENYVIVRVLQKCWNAKFFTLQ